MPAERATPTEPYVISDISELVTNDEELGGLLGIVTDAGLVVDGDRVAWCGPEGDLPNEYAGAPRAALEGRTVIPGFVDAHTHLVFAGDRSAEFARRLSGDSYQSIAQEGGGIVATMAATRSAGHDTLVTLTRRRMERMLARGTTTLEVKSGYGLDTPTEVAILVAAADAASQLPLTLYRTFLGAHAVPPEFSGDRSGYVDLVVDVMLPACAPHASSCDVFVEEGAFSPEEGERVLTAAAALGLGGRVHAEQLSHSGGAALAASMGAISADHLDHATQEDAGLLAEGGTVAVLTPGASFQLRHPPAPARMLWEAGVTVAIATDCNPGTSYLESMPFTVALAVLEMGLDPEQALWAATRGGARALEMTDRGRLRPGDRADFVVLDAPSHLHLPYRPATNLVAEVVCGGIPVPRPPLASLLRSIGSTS